MRLSSKKRLSRPLLAAGLAAATLLAAGLHARASATTLFGLVDTGELYASTDGGVAWTIRATIPASDAVGLAAGASAFDLYLATRSGSIYRSTDAGATWAAVGAVPASDVEAFAIGSFGDLLALTRSGSFYASSNGGATWTVLGVLTGSNWVSLARGPLGALYALAETGEVARSTDQGVSWTTVGAAAVPNAVSLRRLGNDLYALTGTGEIYRSSDYGAAWTAIAALTASGMSALLDVGGAQLVAAAGTGEVAVSVNGTTWAWIGAIDQLRVMALGADTPQATGVEPTEQAPRFAACAPYPNPRVGAGGATFPFSLAGAERVRLELYDARGRLRASRPFERLWSAGAHALRWDPAGLPPGTYLARLVTESGQVATGKWTLMR